MSNFAAARQHMIEGQIKPNQITLPALIVALGEIPRELFVPRALQGVAYVDEDIAVAPGRYLMEPMVFARLVQALALTPADLALDVGCATGYSTAVLSRLCGAVVGLEEDEALAEKANQLLAELQCDNASVARGALVAGCPSQGPYDAILLNGAVEYVPTALADQLKEGGRLAAVVREEGVGKAVLYVKADGVLGRRELFDAAVPPLPGFLAPKKFVF
jgi:protein-L-isoaspartate(D-aspartate) O-methyltransferase